MQEFLGAGLRNVLLSDFTKTFQKFISELLRDGRNVEEDTFQSLVDGRQDRVSPPPPLRRWIRGAEA